MHLPARQSAKRRRANICDSTPSRSFHLPQTVLWHPRLRCEPSAAGPTVGAFPRCARLIEARFVDKVAEYEISVKFSVDAGQQIEIKSCCNAQQIVVSHL